MKFSICTILKEILGDIPYSVACGLPGRRFRGGWAGVCAD